MLVLISVFVACLILLMISLAVAFLSLNVLAVMGIGGGWAISTDGSMRWVIAFAVSIFLPIILFPAAATFLEPRIAILPVSNVLKTAIYWGIFLLPVLVYSAPTIYLIYLSYSDSQQDY